MARTKLVVIFGTALATSLAKRSVSSLVPPQGQKTVFVPAAGADTSLAPPQR